jgi:phosphoketolase
MTEPLSRDLLDRMNAYWRAANYLSVGQIYLLGHWGTTPGLNFIYVHLNRIIRAGDRNIIFICGPGHGGPGMIANAYLEGTYSEVYPSVPQNEAGMKRLFTQFSFPGGVPSHVASETPGSIHERGELGYSLLHAHGAVFDNPDLIACCVIGDGEAETGSLAASWHSNKFLNPARDGAVLPILHLNGYKHIVDSMFNQHAKWLKVARQIRWRRPIASLNYLLTSHVWRQDHNGFSHQDPGFIDHVVNKKADVVRVYLPPDSQHVALRRRPLPAEPQLRQCNRRRQAAGTAMARHRRGVPPLHGRPRVGTVEPGRVVNAELHRDRLLLCHRHGATLQG